MYTATDVPSCSGRSAANILPSGEMAACATLWSTSSVPPPAPLTAYRSSPDTKYTRDPSGDQKGNRASEGIAVICAEVVAPVVLVKIWRTPFISDEYAIV